MALKRTHKAKKLILWQGWAEIEEEYVDTVHVT